MKYQCMKIVSVLLVVMMVVSLLPSPIVDGADISSAEDWEYEGYKGDIKITGYNGSETNVIIPSEIDGKKVTAIGDSVFPLDNEITSITIPDSVSSISVTWFLGYACFKVCNRLESINVDSGNQFYSSQDGVLYNKDKSVLLEYPYGKSGDSFIIPDGVEYLYSYAFLDCGQLTNITIPSSVTGIGPNAFSYCAGLTDINLPKGIKVIGEGAFECCTGLSNITIPNSVTSIGRRAFAGCTGLEFITIPNSVTSIGQGAFGNCTGIESIIIPKSVTSMGNYVFSNCTNLKKAIFMGKKPECIAEDPRDKNPVLDESVFMKTHKDFILYYPRWYEKSWSDYTYYPKKTHCEGGIPVEKIVINKKKITIKKNKKYQLKETVTPINATNINATWLTSDAKVATVSQSGVVTAKRKGKCTIIAVTEDGKIKASCQVTVTVPVTKVKLNRKKLVVKKEKKYVLKAKIMPKDATTKKVSWRSSNKKVATVSKKGVVKARKRGKCTITVITKDGNKKARCKVIVK